MARRVPRTPEANLDRFIDALAGGASVTGACQAANIGRRTVYDLRQRDEAFALRWHDAIETGTDVLEDEALRRALHGVEKPVYQGGKLVGTVREFDTALTIFLLRARRPEVYRERWAVEHSGEIRRGPTAGELERNRREGTDPDVEDALARLAALDAARSTSPIPPPSDSLDKVGLEGEGGHPGGNGIATP